MATFEIKKRSGVVHTVRVDDEDLDRVLDFGSWSVNSRGYVVYLNRRAGLYVALHRFVLEAKPGDPLVDHRDRNKLNNSRSNLRFATIAENNANLDVVGYRGVSQYRGVSYDGSSSGRPWRAKQKIGGVRHHVGRFDTELEAFEALQAFRREHGLTTD